MLSRHVSGNKALLLCYYDAYHIDGSGTMRIIPIMKALLYGPMHPI